MWTLVSRNLCGKSGGCENARFYGHGSTRAWWSAVRNFWMSSASADDNSTISLHPRAEIAGEELSEVLLGLGGTVVEVL